MAVKATGPGKVQQIKTGGEVNALLFNFDIDGVALKVEHRTWLSRHVVPLLKAGGSVTLVARASRTGANVINKMISQERLKQTIAYLKKEVKEFNYKDLIAEGEEHAKKMGIKDGTEHEVFRAVQVAAWKKPEPPPPPPPPPPPATAVDPGTNRIQKREFMFHKDKFKTVEPGQGEDFFNLGKEVLRKVRNPPVKETFVKVPTAWKLIQVTVTNTVVSDSFSELRTYAVTYEWGTGPLVDGRTNPANRPKDTVIVVGLDGRLRVHERSEGERWLTEAADMLVHGL